MSASCSRTRARTAVGQVGMVKKVRFISSFLLRSVMHSHCTVMHQNLMDVVEGIKRKKSQRSNVQKVKGPKLMQISGRFRP